MIFLTSKIVPALLLLAVPEQGPVGTRKPERWAPKPTSECMPVGAVVGEVGCPHWRQYSIEVLNMSSLARSAELLGFLSLSTINILDQIILCGGATLYIMFSSILGLYPLDASGTCPPVVTVKTCLHFPMPWGGKWPRWRPTALNLSFLLCTM